TRLVPARESARIRTPRAAHRSVGKYALHHERVLARLGKSAGPVLARAAVVGEACGVAGTAVRTTGFSLVVGACRGADAERPGSGAHACDADRLASIARRRSPGARRGRDAGCAHGMGSPTLRR